MTGIGRGVSLLPASDRGEDVATRAVLPLCCAVLIIIIIVDANAIASTTYKPTHTHIHMCSCSKFESASSPAISLQL